METASRSVERLTKLVRYSDRTDVMSSCKKLSADGTREIIYSLQSCVVLVLQIRTPSFYPKTILEYSESGTRLAMPKTICAPDTSPLKPGSGATEGVLDYGVLGHLTCWTWAGLMGYEDTRQKTLSRVRMGLSLVWKASLAFEYEDSFLCNRLCTILVPSGVYINRRV